MKITLASARSAPGVTTAALALASTWPGRVLLVEAADDGGVMAPRFGLPLEPGLTTLAASVRHTHDPDVLWQHVQHLPGTDRRVQVLVGPPSAEQAQAVWRAAGTGLATALRATPEDLTVLVDAGRIPVPPAARAVIAETDRLMLVARPRLEDLQAVVARLGVLRGLGPPTELLVVGTRPYSAEEITETLGCPVTGALADDRKAAEALAGLWSGTGLRRSLLLRSARTVADDLQAAMDSRPTAATSPTIRTPFTAARP